MKCGKYLYVYQDGALVQEERQDIEPAAVLRGEHHPSGKILNQLQYCEEKTIPLVRY